MEILAAALGGVLALVGVVVGALVTLWIERRRTAGQIRVALFERRYDGYAAVVAPLSELQDWMVQVCGNLGPQVLTGGDLATFAKEGAPRTNRVTSAMQANSLALDKRGASGILGYLAMVEAIAVGRDALPTLEVLGERFGQAIAACHESLSIPVLAQETYREAARLTRRR